MNTRRLVLVQLVALPLMLGGCGLPSDKQPRALDPSVGPYRALTLGRPDIPAGTQRVVVFFVRDQALVPVPRRIEATPDPAQVLAVVAAGPTKQDQADGLSTALPPGAAPRVIGDAGGVVTVELPTVPETTGRSDAVLGFAQLVLTLTALPDVTGVRFQQDGNPLQVPGADGALTDRPLGRPDYRELIDPG